MVLERTDLPTELQPLPKLKEHLSYRISFSYRLSEEHFEQQMHCTIVTYRQCEQIWRNFATLVKF